MIFENYYEVSGDEILIKAEVIDNRTETGEVSILGIDHFEATGITITEKFANADTRLMITAEALGLPEAMVKMLVIDSYIENFPGEPETIAPMSYEESGTCPADFV